MMRGRLACRSLGQFQLPSTSSLPSTDTITQSPIVKAAVIGGLAAALAKTFPGQFFLPFAAGSVAAVVFGLVPDVSVIGPTAPSPPSQPPRPPSVQPRVG